MSCLKNCGYFLIKFVLSAGNILLMLYGIGNLIYGIKTSLEPRKQSRAANIVMGKTELVAYPTIMIVLCTFGFVTACYEALWMIITYGILLLAFFLYCLYQVINYFHPDLTNRYHIKNEILKQDIYASFSIDFEEAQSGDDRLIASIKYFEQHYECCGVYGFTDYYRYNTTIPNSCYPDMNPNNTVYEIGCAKRYTNLVADLIVLENGILLMSIVGFICIVLTILLGCFVIRDRRAHREYQLGPED